MGRTGLVGTHRPRMNEGWDFCPRLPHQGIWRGVRLVVGAAHVVAVTVTAELTGNDDGVVTLADTLIVATSVPALILLGAVAILPVRGVR